MIMNRYECYKCSQAVTMHFQTNFHLFSNKNYSKSRTKLQKLLYETDFKYLCHVK